MIFTTLAYYLSAQSITSAATSVGLLILLPQGVHSHGYVWDPPGRNSYAHEYGVSSGADSDTLPIRTWNHRGLENGGDSFGACGSNMDYGRNYTKPSDWVTPNGSSVPFLAQAAYTEGEEIVIRSWITANHRGHIEMYGCGDYENPTDECFRQHPLVFVEDMLHGAPKDPAYPLRAMLAPPSVADPNANVSMTTPLGESGDLYVHKFKLPDGLHGGKILLQWYWVTANQCRAQGYSTYPWPDSTWHPVGSLSKACEFPYGDCSRSNIGLDFCQAPQLFRNCIEVKIEQSGPPEATSSPSPHPSLRPSISSAPFGLPEPTDTPSFTPSLRPSTSRTPSPEPTEYPTDTPNSVEHCYDKNAGYQTIIDRDWCNESIDNCNACVGLMLMAPIVRDGCCTWSDEKCDSVDPAGNAGCQYLESDCESCGRTWEEFHVFP